MFNVNGSELLVIAIVAVLVIGPQDMPKALHMLGRMARRLQYIRYAFSRQFDDFLKAHDLDELRHGVNFEAPETDEEKADKDFLDSIPASQKPEKK